ncbi:MAG: hypothetical protein P1S60_18810, partial [Anaerolineae bacterium]|nr:hypothetical protein [Anaerolineae bacterium]
MKGLKFYIMLLLLLAGCNLAPSSSIAEINAGVYEPHPAPAMAGETPWRTINDISSLFVDRQHQVVWIFTNDDALNIIPY